jgi:hypothetical protein
VISIEKQNEQWLSHHRNFEELESFQKKEWVSLRTAHPLMWPDEYVTKSFVETQASQRKSAPNPKTPVHPSEFDPLFKGETAAWRRFRKQLRSRMNSLTLLLSESPLCWIGSLRAGFPAFQIQHESLLSNSRVGRPSRMSANFRLYAAILEYRSCKGPPERSALKKSLEVLVNQSPTASKANLRKLLDDAPATLTDDNVAGVIGCNSETVAYIRKHFPTWNGVVAFLGDQNSLRVPQLHFEELETAAQAVTLEYALLHLPLGLVTPDSTTSEIEYAEGLLARGVAKAIPKRDNEEALLGWMYKLSLNCFRVLPEDLRQRAEVLIDISGKLTEIRTASKAEKPFALELLRQRHSASFDC